jgi:p-aminobenzoyl-glutamate transporter AbgT
MTPEVRRELKTWAQYFVIAFAAEMVAFVIGFTPHCDNCAYQVSALFQHLYWEYEQPRLRFWFATFLVLSAIRFLIFSASRKWTTNSRNVS